MPPEPEKFINLNHLVNNTTIAIPISNHKCNQSLTVKFMVSLQGFLGHLLAFLVITSKTSNKIDINRKTLGQKMIRTHVVCQTHHWVKFCENYDIVWKERNAKLIEPTFLIPCDSINHVAIVIQLEISIVDKPRCVLMNNDSSSTLTMNPDTMSYLLTYS